MCIAVYKPIGVNLPSLSLVSDWLDSNPDGAGYAVPSSENPGRILIRKGFFEPEKFLSSIATDCTKGLPALFHARIGTSGTISAAHCHPFPICRERKYLEYPHCLANSALIHNGIFPGYGNKEESDTMEITREIVHGLDLSDKSQFNLFNSFCHLAKSKVAIMDYSGSVVLYGEWTEHESGYWYSNLYWEALPLDNVYQYGDWGKAGKTEKSPNYRREWTWGKKKKTRKSGIRETCEYCGRNEIVRTGETAYCNNCLIEY